MRGDSVMNSRELAADVPLATQESDEDEFEVSLFTFYDLRHLIPTSAVC